VFEGFLPRKGKERRSRLAGIASDERTVVMFASPHRLEADLQDLLAELGGERQIAVARELTKLHEEVWVGSLADAIERWSGDARGEITIVIEGGTPVLVSEEEAVRQAVDLVGTGMSRSDAARQTATSTGVSKRVIYEALLEAQDSI
jgi:16S rRNA (cytidine1402-2'-O)-methyltransferase